MKAIYKLFFLMFLSQVLWAQTPGIPYQAVIMDKESGQELPGLDNNYMNPMSNSLVSIRFSIYDENGMEFEETHHSVKIDEYGMINLVVGKGVYTFNHFYDDMVWNGEGKWLKVEIDFENGNNFEDLDYLPLHRMPTLDDQKLSLSGPLLYLEDGGMVNLSDLAKDSVFVTTLVKDTIFSIHLAKDSVFVRELTKDSVFLSNLDSVDDDNQNLTSFTLLGTELEVDIEDGDSVKVDLIGLATDSSFVRTLATDSVFSRTLAKDSVFVTTLAKDTIFSKHLARDSVFVRELTKDTVFLSNLDSVDDDNQNLSVTIDSLLIEDGTGVKLSDLGTDNQNISNLAINTTSNILTVGIEDGISQTVDLTHLDNTGTDNQNISNLAVNTTSNILTIGIEDGISQTIDLTHLDDAGTDDQKIDSLSLIGSFLSISLENDGEAAKKVNLSALSSDGWKLSGNSATSPGTDFLGTTDAQDLVIKTNNVERFRVKNDGSRALFANPGDFSTPGLSPTALLGIDGTDHARLRLTAGNAESYDDSKGASIDLHGNTSTVNKGVLDLVAGSAANGSLGAIKFWTNTNGSSQQTSAVITGSGDM